MSNFNSGATTLKWYLSWGGRRLLWKLRPWERRKLRQRAIYRWQSKLSSTNFGDAAVTTRFLYSGRYSRATINFWPTLRYYRFRSRTDLYNKDRAHYFFMGHMQWFWEFLTEAVILLKNRQRRFYFVDSTPTERIGFLHEFSRFRVIRFVRNTRYLWQARIRTLFLQAHRAMRTTSHFFVLQLMSSLQKLRLHLQTRYRRNILALHPGLFCTLLSRSKASRSSKLIRLVMLHHFQQLVAASRLPPFMIEVVGIPRFLGDLLRALWSAPTETFREEIRDTLQFDLVPQKISVQVPFIWFREIVKFSSQKLPKRGRIKRKIRRKLQRQGGLVD
jgi:hypothetical protein